jgi:hypothetical protein
VTPVGVEGLRFAALRAGRRGLTIDSAEKVFFRKSEKNISYTDALYRTVGAWLIIFFILNLPE